MTKKNQKYFILGGILLALFIGSFFISKYYANKPGDYDEFATCIEKSGAKFYGAFWCPHCQAQKALFGKSKNLLPYVECSTANGQGQTDECKAKTIESYPTWEFLVNGTTTRVTGEQSFDKLSSLTGCKIPDGYVTPKTEIADIKVEGNSNVKIEQIEVSTSTVK
jgi:thiol-disulfide isomerase/thioredoxin